MIFFELSASSNMQPHGSFEFDPQVVVIKIIQHYKSDHYVGYIIGVKRVTVREVDIADC